MLAGLLVPATVPAAARESIVGGHAAPSAVPGPRFRQQGNIGSWVTASARRFERARVFSLSAPGAGSAPDALLHPYVRATPVRRGLHRQLEAGLALPLAGDLSLATAYGKVRLRGAMPSAYSLKTEFAKVGLKLAF